MIAEEEDDLDGEERGQLGMWTRADLADILRVWPFWVLVLITVVLGVMLLNPYCPISGVTTADPEGKQGKAEST